MTPLTILDNIAIASPCEANWDEMAGDDRSRFCASCSKHVYNIGSMTAEEASSLFLESEGKLCARIFRRSDGTVLTADCPVGIGRISPARRVRRILTAAVVLPVLLVAGVAASGLVSGIGIGLGRAVGPFPTGPGVTWNDRFDWAMLALGLRVRQEMTLGAISPPMGEISIRPALPSTINGAPACDLSDLDRP